MATTTAAGFASGMDVANVVMPTQGAGDSARVASSGDAFGATMSDTLRENDRVARIDAPSAASSAPVTGTSPAGGGNAVPAAPPAGASAAAADGPAPVPGEPAGPPAAVAAGDDSLARLLADIDALRGTGTDAMAAAASGEASADADALDGTADEGGTPADVDGAVDPALVACVLPAAQPPATVPSANTASLDGLATAAAGNGSAGCDGAASGVGMPGAGGPSPVAHATQSAAEPVAAALADDGQPLGPAADPAPATTATDALAGGSSDAATAGSAAGAQADAISQPAGHAGRAHHDDASGSLPRADGAAASPAGETRAAAAPRVSAMGELFAQLQPSGLAEQVSQRVVWMHQLGVHLARMQVHPSDLGPIDIALDQRDGSIAVSMTAHHPATRELLESHLPRMREQLAADGANIERFDVFGGDGRGDDGREAGEGAADGRRREDARDTIEAAPAIRLPIRAAGLFEAYA